MKIANPRQIKPSKERVCAEKVRSFLREKKAKATNQRLNVKSQNKMEPSCPPHVAATLKNVGSWELECAATYSNVKSSVAKE